MSSSRFVVIFHHCSDSTIVSSFAASSISAPEGANPENACLASDVSFSLCHTPQADDRHDGSNNEGLPDSVPRHTADVSFFPNKANAISHKHPLRCTWGALGVFWDDMGHLGAVWG